MMREQIGATAVRRSLGWCAVGACVLMISGGQALALDRDIVNSKGFEAPDFTTTFLGTGELTGQVNPVGFGQIISPGQWLTTGDALEAIVQDSVFAPGGGSQAVRVERNGNTSTRWGIPVNNQAYPEYPADIVPAGEDPQPCICINWDMRVEGPAGVDGDFGPYFGVEANDDDVSGLTLLGSLGVDATTGEVLYQAPGSGNLTAAGPVAAFGTWHNYQIKLDFSTHDYTIYYDKVPLGTFAFVDGPEDQFSEANIFALPASGAPADMARVGTAFFDNFLSREGMCNVIPEPTTIALALMGLALVPQIARRQRRASN